MELESRPLILVVEDDEGTALLQRRRLERANFRVEVAANVDRASEVLARGDVSLVLIDFRLGSTSGLDFHRRMKATGLDLPVIVVSGAMDDASVIEAMRAGVRDVVLKTHEYLDYLPEAVRSVLNQPVRADWPSMDRPTGSVVIVEDDIGVATLQRRHLERAGYEVMVARDAEEALRIAKQGKINLAVLDLRLPGNVSGLDLYERFKKVGLSIPAILVTAFPDQSVAIRALRAGIRDFVPKTADYLEYLPTAVDRIAAQAQVERKLIESELRFASIVGTTMDAIIMCDARRNILLFNRSAEEMFECEATEAVKQPLARFLPALKLGEANDGEDSAAVGSLRHRMELDGVTATGDLVPIEVSISDVIVHGERFFTVIARDVSERRRIEEQLREADRRKNEFLGMLAHELRNPLAAIMTAGDVLSRITQNDSGQKLTTVVRRQTQALARMVDDLLDVSRVTQGKIHLAKEPLVLQHVIDRALEGAQSAAQQKNLVLQAQMQHEPVRVLADATRLEQVLVNLLNNAMKFTPAGGRIELHAMREGHEAVVRVRDTGVGIDPKLLPRIFDLFVQGETTLDRSKSGLGIGLALVRQVLELHGGTVSGTSDGLGKGSEFILRLPISEQPNVAMRTASTISDEASRPLQILVVDDQRDVADSLAALLAAAGHHSRAIYDGKAALAASLVERPDAMIVDIGMPGVTGYELAHLVREQPTLAGVYLIALTGYGREQDRLRASEAGFDLHLTKPISSSAITAALQRFCSATV